MCQIAEDCRRRTSPEGRSCKLQGKAPITGPYTPKWRPNDQEERAHCWVGCWVTDKADGEEKLPLKVSRVNFIDDKLMKFCIEHLNCQIY